MASSIYRRVSDLESYIPQLDAAQTENANELLRMIAMLTNSHNRLVTMVAEVINQDKSASGARLKEQFYELIVNINEALDDPK